METNTKETFSVGGVIKEAYAIMKPKFWSAIGQYLLIGFVLQILFAVLLGKGAFLGSIITTYICIRWALAYTRKGSFNFDDIFENVTFKKFVYYIYASFLVGISIIGGFLLLIVPGIIFAVRLTFATYFAIDKDVKPMEALRESKRITKGNRWKLYWFLVVCVFINILGLLCLIVGVLFTAPLTAIATAIVYKKLLKMKSVVTPEIVTV